MLKNVTASGLGEVDRRGIRLDRKPETNKATGITGTDGTTNAGGVVSTITDEAAATQVAVSRLVAVPQVNEAKVSAIRKSIADGAFVINPDRIASKLLALDNSLPAIPRDGGGVA